MAKTYKTCKILETALYLAPNEIRACCKRFFYENKIRGDAKLIKIEEGVTPKINEIKEAREKLFNEIQENKNEYCKGCTFLEETRTKPTFNSDVSFLSIEHHSVCNLRCNYCSEIYWGGKKSKYNVSEFVKYLSENNNLDSCNQIVWGGGEPTLDKSFEEIFNSIDSSSNPKLYHRVFTNSVRYSEALNQFLKKGLVKITTSIDAGTEYTFKKIRGRQKFLNVFENLEKYSKNDPSKITIKYIFTEDNNNEIEINNFVENCLKFNLSKCNYQISVNYKTERIAVNDLKQMLYLFSKLSEKKIKRIFFDDHIVERLTVLNNDEIEEITLFLKNNNSADILLNSNNFDNLIIFGAGNIANQIIDKSNFFKKIKNYDIVDSDDQKIGKILNKKEILSPLILNNDDRKIFIASAQHYDEILNSIVRIKGNSKNVVTGIIL